MSSLISAADLAGIRTDLVDVLMPDLFDIIRLTCHDNGWGGDDGGWTTVASDVPGRLAMVPMTRGNAEAIEGAEVQAHALCYVYAPISTGVLPKDKLVVNQTVQVEVMSVDYAQQYNSNDRYICVVLNDGEITT